MSGSHRKTRLEGMVAAAVCVCLTLTLAACSTGASVGSTAPAQANSSASAAASSSASVAAGSQTASSAVGSKRADVPTKDSISTSDTFSNSADGEHAIEANGTTDSYANVAVRKTGNADGDDADFYGENASVFATNGATLTLSDATVESDGTHANGVFSYGEGTTVNISDSVIETSGNCSGGLMTTGGATMNAENLRITTDGNSSAAIRSDRGGGTVNVTRGIYTTNGTGSPAIYSTADITVNDATLESTAAQGVVVEGKNSVTLNNVDLVANNSKKNSNKSEWYQAVMIYQSMSGDAANGKASFSMNNGSLANKNGDVFFVNNTVADISLSGSSIVNEDANGVFLRAAAAGWGSEGSNGGQVTLNASGQQINGNMIVDSVSNLNLYLAEGSTFNGAINPDGQAGDVYVELKGGSTWTLTGDAYVKSLTCEAGSINLNGHTLYVDGVAYADGAASSGTPIEVVVSESGGHGGATGGKPSGSSSGAAPKRS